MRADALSFLEHAAAHYWPAATTDGAFSCELLAGGDLDAQYWHANIDPSDQYVQSLPGSGRFRLRADASGFDNLFLAGDWIDCGLNAGCVEAATIAGIQAANAVRRRPLMDGVLGLWCGFETAATERGVAFVKGTDFLLEGGESALRIAYSGVTTDQIEEGVRRLAAAYAESGGDRPRSPTAATG